MLPSMSVQAQLYLASLRQEPQFQGLLQEIQRCLARPSLRYRRQVPQSEQIGLWAYSSGFVDGQDNLLHALLEADWTKKPIQPKRNP